MADNEATKVGSEQIHPDVELMKQDTQQKGYFENITGWVNNKLGTSEITEMCALETAKDDTQINKRPGYLQYLGMGWVKDKISGVSNCIITDKDSLTKEPDLDKAKPSGYLQYLSIGWVKDKMAGGINPFVTENIKKQVEANPKEDKNDVKDPSGYLSYLSFDWVKDRMHKTTNNDDTNPYDICAVSPQSEDNQNKNAGVWDKIKFDNEYVQINKDKVKEYMPDMKTVENTSDVVKTVGELTGLPFLQGIGTIIKKTCTLSRQVTVLGGNEEEGLKTNIEDVAITKSNDPNLYSEVIEKLKSGELNFEMIKFILEMAEFQEHKIKEFHMFPNLYYKRSYSAYVIMTNIYERDEDYIYRRRRFW